MTSKAGAGEAGAGKAQGGGSGYLVRLVLAKLLAVAFLAAALTLLGLRSVRLL